VNDHPEPLLLATPDGRAELRLVVRLSWSDIAALGREASRPATAMQRTVSLDEAASHRLSAQPQSAAPAQGQGQTEAPQRPPAAVGTTPPVEQGRQANELARRAAASSAALESSRPGEHFLNAG
jgi:hypothetical protein